MIKPKQSVSADARKLLKYTLIGIVFVATTIYQTILSLLIVLIESMRFHGIRYFIQYRKWGLFDIDFYTDQTFADEKPTRYKVICAYSGETEATNHLKYFLRFYPHKVKDLSLFLTHNNFNVSNKLSLLLMNDSKYYVVEYDLANSYSLINHNELAFDDLNIHENVVPVKSVTFTTNYDYSLRRFNMD